MKHLFTAAISMAAVMTASSAMAQTEIQWWHAMTGANNEVVNKLAADFNASQSDYKVVAGLQGHLSRHAERRHRRLPRRAARRTSCRSSRSAPRR